MTFEWWFIIGAFAAALISAGCLAVSRRRWHAACPCTQRRKQP
ncbi:hypothetical protein ACFQ0G_53910 [Streptomyces chiangmaiensis]